MVNLDNLLYMVCAWIFAASVLQGVHAQSTRSWTAHTSAREVTSISAGLDMVWTASRGGIYGYTPSSGEISRYTAAEGMYDVNVRAIAWDSERRLVWVGYTDGVFERLDIDTDEIITFFDIFRSDRFPLKEINAMEVSGDSILIATGFGLVIFDPIRNEVRDTYSRFGQIPPATPVNDVILADVSGKGADMWIATDAGIASAPLSGSSLQDPANWISQNNISPSPTVTDIIYHHERLYIGTPLGLASQQPDGSFSRVGASNRPIMDLNILNDQVIAVFPFRLRSYNQQGTETVIASGFQDLRAVAVNGSDVWLGDGLSGLNHYTTSSGNLPLTLVSAELYPDGPFDSPFGDLSSAMDGSLWATAQLGISQSGIYRMTSNGRWTNFTSRFNTEIEKGSYWRVHVDNQGTAWAGSRGGGLAQITLDDVITTYDHENSILLPASGTQDFVIIGGISSSDDGILWLTNTNSPYPLHFITSDGSWGRLLSPQCPGAPQSNSFGDIFVDSNGIIWIILLESGNLNLTRGILILDTNDTLDDASDDLCTYYSTAGSNGSGLPGARIQSITEDLNGRIWIGTNGGPAFFRSSISAATDPTLEALWPVWGDRSDGTYVLRGLSVNDIAVDPSNRLWIATPDGVYLLSESDGFDLIAHFRSDNSPLLSDQVITITIDGSSGRVFMGTDKGLISALSDAVTPSEQTMDLFVYPNPVQISSSQDTQIYIDGLVTETEISITAIHGDLVRRMQARGGRGVWDGRNQDGELVSSGMYLIVARGKNGEGIAYGKVAVIH